MKVRLWRRPPLAVVAVGVALSMTTWGAPAGATRRVPGSLDQVRTTMPAPRAGAGMAGDVNGNIVLFGGVNTNFDCCLYYGDTWTWNGSAWTEQFPANSPSPRTVGAMTYDAAHGQVVLFGGQDQFNVYLDETWTWDGSNWTKQHPAHSPTKVFSPGMAYDAARHQVVMSFDPGNLDPNVTWTWDGTDWTQQFPSNAPWDRTGFYMAYDGARRDTVIFGGLYTCGYESYCNRKETYVWNGTTWKRMNPANHPPAVAGGGLVYDATRKLSVMFGGGSYLYGDFGETWTWNGQDWTKLGSAHTPDPRGGQAMAWDRVRHQIVLFGGANFHDLYFADTWTWNGSDWTCAAGCS
jgi:hypothetical protein